MADKKEELVEEVAVEDVDHYSAENAPADTEAVEDMDEKELEEMKRKVEELEEEARKLKEMQEQVDMATSAEPNKEEVDARSIFVGNVDYSVTAEELQQHFAACGTINRVTILCDKWTGHPKGFAYIEFADKSSVNHAMELNETILKGRPLKVMQKRTNIPSVLLYRGRGRGRPPYMYPPYFPRGRGRPPFRARGIRGYYYHPYY